MLASKSCSNQISSFPFMNQTVPENSITDPNPTSLHFTDCTPFLDDGFILSHIFHSDQQHQLLPTFNPPLPLPSPVELQYCSNATDQEARRVPWQKNISAIGSSNQRTSRKRSSKAIHSKICTSKGPRDRRMRLSLEIARSFFDLQDMLGFDKASETVEWLFSKSRTAIKELKEKFFANCNYSDDSKSTDTTDLERNLFRVCDKIPREKKRRQLRVVDKESRCKARARARERTREKMIHRRLQKSKQDSEEKVDEPENQLLEYETDAKILGMEGESAACLIQNQLENKLLSREMCSDPVQFPGSPMEVGTMSLESMRPSPWQLQEEPYASLPPLFAVPAPSCPCPSLKAWKNSPSGQAEILIHRNGQYNTIEYK